MDVMGTSLNEIAYEKAGVIKPGRPVVIGPTCLDLPPIFEQAELQQAEVISIPEQQTHEQVNNNIVYQIIQ
jgi:folylpolyglutamate synthase/dihydropteroate synthase